MIWNKGTAFEANTQPYIFSDMYKIWQQFVCK